MATKEQTNSQNQKAASSQTKDAATQAPTPSADSKVVTEGAGVATVGENNRLSHSEGGATTRSDVTDMGVPMLQGDGTEPQGPEDALGAGLKRGDYTNRIGGSSYQPHEVVPNPDAKAGEATVKVIAQRPRTEEIGDETGIKGGVDTSTTLGE